MGLLASLKALFIKPEVKAKPTTAFALPEPKRCPPTPPTCRGGHQGKAPANPSAKPPRTAGTLHPVQMHHHYHHSAPASNTVFVQQDDSMLDLALGAAMAVQVMDDPAPRPSYEPDPQPSYQYPAPEPSYTAPEPTSYEAPSYSDSSSSSSSDSSWSSSSDSSSSWSDSGSSGGSDW
jgi:hypothetical protein